MRTPAVVHLLPDEKFADTFIGLVHAHRRDGHHFLLDPANADGALRHASHTADSTVLDPRRPVAAQAHDLVSGARTLVVHFMSPRARELVLSLPAHTRLFWSGWGGDYYHLLAGGQEALYGSLTRRFVSRLDFAAATGTAARMRCALKQLGGARAARILRRHRWLRVISRVDLFSAPISEDYVLLRRALGPRFGASYCQVNYGSVEETFAPPPSAQPDALVVQLGNSADPIGNHLDAAAAIPGHCRGQLELVVPLSYGRRDYARQLGRELARQGFRTVTVLGDFMPLDRYAASTSRCGVAVFNAKRQHAIGNVGAALCRGARVFLDTANPLLGCLRTLGAMVESTGELGSAFGDSGWKATGERAGINRKALALLWGRAVVDRNAREFLRTVEE